jgi:hypothetical protein
MVCHGDCCL